MYSANTSDSITAWVVDTLAKIGDATAVSVCINILITTYNPSVQELALSLLASILMVSDEAVAQMLVPYSSSGTAAVIDSNDDTVRRSSGKRANSGRIPSVEELESAAGAAEVKQDHHPAAAAAKSIDIKKLNLNFSYNTMDYSSRKVVHEKPKKMDKPKTCLSYVLSVILLQKNRHLLAAGCADIILAMLRKNKREMSEAIAQTATCELPAIDDRKSKNDTRSSLSKFNAQSEEHAAHTSAPLSTTIIEWAGLKLLLKFLFRYEKMNAQSKTATKAIVRESVSASLHLKEEYAYAHSKVFTAVCQLIAGSAVVAAQANTLSGAEQLLTFTFNRFDASDSHMYSVFVACTNALAQDKLLQQRRRAHEQEMQRLGGHCPAESGDLRLSDFMLMRSSCPEKICENRPVSPQELRERLNKKKPILGGSISPSKASGPSRRGKGALHVSASADGRLGAGPRKEVLDEAVELNRNIKVNFHSEFQVETEKRELYLLNSYDAKYGTHATGDLKALSKQADRTARQTPLSYHPEVDSLIGTSLDSMGAAALKPITDPRPKLTEAQRREAEFLLGGPHGEEAMQDNSALNVPSVTSSSVAQTSQTSSYPPRQYRRNEEDELVFANSQAFFNSLPAQPVVPLRIEPKDVIVPMEDLTRIRQKFQTMAETAQTRGEIYLYNNYYYHYIADLMLVAAHRRQGEGGRVAGLPAGAHPPRIRAPQVQVPRPLRPEPAVPRGGRPGRPLPVREQLPRSVALADAGQGAHWDRPHPGGCGLLRLFQRRLGHSLQGHADPARSCLRLREGCAGRARGNGLLSGPAELLPQR